jgi:hypothetical protein
LDALAQNFRGGLPWELLYADDLVLVAESEERLLEKIRKWKTGLESKGLKVNVGKTKVLKCNGGAGTVEKSGRWPCGVCNKGVGNNSIFCTKCGKWIHKRCSNTVGKIVSNEDFECPKCMGLVVTPKTEHHKASLMLETGVEFECVDRFCYLGDMIGAGGGAELASIVRVRCAWGKFWELSGFLMGRGVPLKIKGKIYKACVQSVMVYGSETWPMRVEDQQRLERTERMMTRLMCGVSMKDRISSDELRRRLGFDSVCIVVRRGRLRWFGHVERKAEDDWVKKCRSVEIEGKVARGRGRKTWMECVRGDMKDLNLSMEDVVDRDVWRRKTFGEPSEPRKRGNNRR